MDFGWDPEDFQPEDPSDAVTLARHATVTADCAADVGCSWSISSLVGMCNLCLSIYIYILIYHSFGCSQLIEVKQNYLETNTTIPKCWWYYIYICINVYRHLCMHASDVLCYTYMILYVNFNSYRRFMCCLLIMSTTQLFSLLGAVPCTSTFLICWGLLRCSWPTRQL